MVIEETEPILRLVERFVAEAMAAVETDDTGLWEYRTFPNKYTFSHALCWVAVMVSRHKIISPIRSC